MLINAVHNWHKLAHFYYSKPFIKCIKIQNRPALSRKIWLIIICKNYSWAVADLQSVTIDWFKGLRPFYYYRIAGQSPKTYVTRQ